MSLRAAEHDAGPTPDADGPGVAGKRTLTQARYAGGGGQALPGPLATQMSHSLGADFSQVRVHEGTHVGAMGAQAYALGHELHFAPGQYAPDTTAGRELIGHELAHVVQQQDGRVAPTVQAKGAAVNDDPALEAEADHAGALAARGEPVALARVRYAPLPPTGATVQRKIWRLAANEKVRDSSTPELTEADEQAVRAAVLRKLVELTAAETARLDQVMGPSTALDLDVLHTESTDAIAERVRVVVRPAAVAAAAQNRDEKPDEPAMPEGPSTSADMKAFLAGVLSSGKYEFSNPPLQSSGDVYHTVGFLAILRELGLPLPRVTIGHFGVGDSYYKHAKRALDYAQALGFSDHVTLLPIPISKSDQLNSRLATMRAAIAARGAVGPIFDQKMATGLIAYAMSLNYQWTTGVLARQMTTYENEAKQPTSAAQVASDEWQAQQLEWIARVAGAKKRLVLFNCRAGDSQDQQDTTGGDFTAMATELAAKGFAVYTLNSSDKPPTAASLPRADQKDAAPPWTQAFEGAGKTGKNWDAKGFNTKVQHLQLLKRIKETYGERLVGMYGSTSGTTDAPALIGIRTLSMHTFSIDVVKERTGVVRAKRGGLNAQDQREILMTRFKTVGRRGLKDLDGPARALITAWCSAPHPPRLRGEAIPDDKQAALSANYHRGMTVPNDATRRGAYASTAAAAVTANEALIQAKDAEARATKAARDNPGDQKAKDAKTAAVAAKKKATAGVAGNKPSVHAAVAALGGDEKAASAGDVVRRKIEAIYASVFAEAPDLAEEDPETASWIAERQARFAIEREARRKQRDGSNSSAAATAASSSSAGRAAVASTAYDAMEKDDGRAHRPPAISMDDRLDEDEADLQTAMEASRDLARRYEAKHGSGRDDKVDGTAAPPQPSAPAVAMADAPPTTAVEPVAAAANADPHAALVQRANAAIAGDKIRPLDDVINALFVALMENGADRARLTAVFAAAAARKAVLEGPADGGEDGGEDGAADGDWPDAPDDGPAAAEAAPGSGMNDGDGAT